MTTVLKPVLRAFGALAAASGAVAQPVKPPALATRAEFRRCLDDMDGMKAREVRIGNGFDLHAAAVRRLQQEIVEHAKATQRAGVASRSAAEAYNREVAKFKSRGQALNQEAEDLNKDREAYNVQVVEIQARCGAMAVAIEDRDAVVRERETEGKK